MPMATSSKRRYDGAAPSRSCRQEPSAFGVYAGMDPISKKRSYISEVVPARFVSWFSSPSGPTSSTPCSFACASSGSVSCC